ncbi:MAG: hypothetical protein DHS20C01_12220 [marine bacterium B5-7]|nr:MAG: hypothetical protein DHS20C01_12220 [marine bacterium B5-7]
MISSKSVKELCTICITANPVVDHPNITYIKQTIESLDHIQGIEGATILLAHDGNEGNLISDEIYAQYMDNLERYIAEAPRDFKIVSLQHREYLTGNLKNAMRYVTTPFVFNIQHDTPFIRAVNVSTVLTDMLNHPQMKHVRFNRRPNFFKGFDKRGPNCIWEEFRTENNAYIKTNGWSATNHIARTDYLNDLLSTVNKRSPEKFVMQMAVKPPPWREWLGTFLYGGFDEPAYTTHEDARRLVDFWSVY